MESQNFSAFSDLVEDSLLDEFIRNIPDDVDEFIRNIPDDVLSASSIPALECDTPGAAYSNTNEADAAVWDLTQDIIDVDLFPEPITSEHNQMSAEDLLYQTPTLRNSPVSRTPKKPRGPASKKGKACKVKPRRIVYTKENIPLLMEKLTEVPEAATAIIHPTSLAPKCKVMRKTPPAPLQSRQISENCAAPVWTAIQSANGPVRTPPVSPICVVQGAGNPVLAGQREIRHSIAGQSSTSRVNDPRYYIQKW
ncbi:uncharacterized protein [Ranitomeya imitator]|uniref:uncharacterized protein n=1 Tax=Ranitomeya imitator TaxID=111125 RepID=UPI0037E711A7